MTIEEDQQQSKRSIASESSLTRTENSRNPKRYCPGFENNSGSKIKQLLIRPTDVQHLNETQEHLSETLNLSGTEYLNGTNNLSGTEDLHKTKENSSGIEENCVIQKLKEVTLKEIRHGVVN